MSEKYSIDKKIRQKVASAIAAAYLSVSGCAGTPTDTERNNNARGTAIVLSITETALAGGNSSNGQNATTEPTATTETNPTQSAGGNVEPKPTEVPVQPTAPAQQPIEVPAQPTAPAQQPTEVPAQPTATTLPTTEHPTPAPTFTSSPMTEPVAPGNRTWDQVFGELGTSYRFTTVDGIDPAIECASSGFTGRCFIFSWGLGIEVNGKQLTEGGIGSTNLEGKLNASAVLASARNSEYSVFNGASVIFNPGENFNADRFVNEALKMITDDYIASAARNNYQFSDISYRFENIAR